MKNLLLIIGLFIGTGMSCSHLQRGDASASNFRMFWTSEGFEFDAETNGTTRIKLQKSNPDAESIKAAAEGATKGAVEGMK